MKFLKVGRVAIITRGRYAGKKVRFDSQKNSRPKEKCTCLWMGDDAGPGRNYSTDAT